jgi:16S rRNA (cytidine1402-2'-O)-methyltransferase
MIMTGTTAKSSGTLFVVATPIGNLDDLTPRARKTLCQVEIVAAEDTRRTRGLLSTIGAQPRLLAYHEHNEEARTEELLERLRAGTDIALVSDAGMPLISDPGWRLVATALAAGIKVRAIPGPSAVLAALAVSGLATDRYAFEGFLPRRAERRAEYLRDLAHEPRTLVFFESVHRLEDTLRALAAEFGGERRAALARELTKVYEDVYTGSLAELCAELGRSIPLLGEFAIVVAGAEEKVAVADDEIRRIFALLRTELPPDKATALTASITGAARNTVYRLARVGGSSGQDD